MLIVGLGNPGEEYTETRHNIGRSFLLDLAESEDFSEWKKDNYLKALISEKTNLENQKTILALPETFMNRSGESVREILRKYNLPTKDVVVIYDDIDLPIGSLKISQSRGAGGHNGVQSIIDHLGTTDFLRIRIGICPTDESGEKRKPNKDVVSRFVLARFAPTEKEKLAKLFPQIVETIKTLSKDGAEKAMNAFNKK